MGVALLPLAYRGCRGVQVQCEHRLAELQSLAQPLDVGRAELPYWRRADGVELAHRHLADRAGIVQRGQIAAQGFNELARHNTPPIERLSAALLSSPLPVAPETPYRRTAVPSFRPA